MRTASVAEWILAKVATRGRAASMAGDLVEMNAQKGLFRFWLSVARVLLSLCWRWPVAFISAFYGGMFAVYAFVMAATGIHALHTPPDYPWSSAFQVLGLVGATLCAASLFAAIRFGLHERTTQMALAWSGVVTIVIFFWWQPAALSFAIAAALFLAALSLSSSKRRREASVVLVSVTVGCVAMIWSGIVVTLYQHVLQSGPWGDKEMSEHPSLNWVMTGSVLVAFWVATTTWSRMRAWLMRTHSLESQREML